MRDIFEVKNRDEKIFKVLKYIQVGIFIALGIFAFVLLVTLIFGGLFFDLDAALVGNWFSTVVVIIFILTAIVELVLFIVWFLVYPPFVLLSLLGALLLVFLGRGAGEIATDYGLNASFGDILTGIILFFIIGCELFINYKISLTTSFKKEEK